jgi:diguanylate cyclase (GGDEF)-like protein/PAS domain S-box-containing protein
MKILTPVKPASKNGIFAFRNQGFPDSNRVHFLYVRNVVSKNTKCPKKCHPLWVVKKRETRVMNENQSLETIHNDGETNSIQWEKPDKLILKLTLITVFSYNILFIYQLAIHYFIPNIPISYYDIVTNLYVCLAVNIASCLILYRHQRMVNQVDRELSKRLRSEQALQQIAGVLDERVAERTAELERINQGFVQEILQRERVQEELEKAYEYLENIFENSADGIGIVDERGNLTKWNKAAEEIYGYEAEELLGKPVFHLYANKDELDRMLVKLRQDGYIRNYEIDMTKKDGGIITCSLSIRMLCSNDGKVIGSVTVARDLTETKSTLANLKLVNEKLQDLVIESEHRNRQMAMLQEMGDVLQASQTLEETYNVIAHFGTQFFPDFTGALYIHNSSKHLFEAVATWGEKPPQELVFGYNECWALRRSRMNLVVSSASLLRCRHVSSPSPFGYLCVPMMAQGEALGILHLQKVSPEDEDRMYAASQLASTVAEGIALALANMKLREALRDQAIRDPLTGLFNRRYMMETFERELAGAQRRGDSLVVVTINLDNFKEFNDTFGHDMGDEFLTSFGDFLRTSIRKEDIACRFGGEEFILILPGASLDAGLKKAEEIRSGARQLQIPNGQLQQPVTFSMGIAVYLEHGLTTHELINAADKAMYRAKKSGGDRVITAQRIQSQVLDKISAV